jgi:histone-lysine N-methyltransferase SETMAR
MIFNSDTYVKTPKEGERTNQACLPEKNTLLPHGNARPHTCAATSATVDSIGYEVVPHPPYSPDLAPSDFWFFGALKKHLKSNCFTCDEVRTAMAKWFREQPEKFYSDGFETLVQRWLRCIEREWG